MQYAWINGTRAQAQKDKKGTCPNCGEQLVAKCGPIKVHHWAHKGNRHCDPWWETETPWHRAWKSQYPTRWQECPTRDTSTGERHIADVCTENGLVIEFQHSALAAQERQARETFYQRMVWVVDGTRLKYDYPRFCKRMHDFRITGDPYLFYFDAQDECFPSAWLHSAVPVLFDFKGGETMLGPGDPRNYLYGIQPNINGKYAFLVKMTHQTFIEKTSNGEWLSMIEAFFARPNYYEWLQRAHAGPSFPLRKRSPYVYEKGKFIRRTRL